MRRFFLAATLATAALAAPAQAVTLVADKCVSVTDAAGCLFRGNIAPNTVAATEAAYNAARGPDIGLDFLTKNDDGDFNSFGSVTGLNGKSGTWSLPGFLVDYIAVKAGNQFVLYATGGASSGSWNTGRLGNKDMSHLTFFGTTAVPEPATWAMMIGGFVAVGAAARRRRRATAAIA